MPDTHKSSESCLKLIKYFEGLRLKTYTCSGGKLTIGYGHTGPDVKPGMTITQAEADSLLLADLSRFESGVVGLLGGRETTPGQFSALVALAFNIGLSALGKSTLLTFHKAGDFALAADQFLRWNRGGGRVLPGLTKRREAERELYLS